jgi:hypothetical protein
MTSKRKRAIRMKKAARLKKATRSSTSSFFKTSTRVTRGIGAGAVAVVVMCVVAAAMLTGASQPSEPADIASQDTQPETAPVQAVAKSAPAARPVAVKTPAKVASPVNAPAAKSSEAPVPMAASVTVTGCLEHANETFRLKDATGLDARTSRNWKSGFLKRRSASIEVVDAGNGVRLPDHVGQRVSVTGTLVDREIQVRSLQRVAASCASSRKVRI